MTNPTESSKIVDLQTRQVTQSSGGGDRLGELLRGVRATALKRLQGSLSFPFFANPASRRTKKGV